MSEMNGTDAPEAAARARRPRRRVPVEFAWDPNDDTAHREMLDAAIRARAHANELAGQMPRMDRIVRAAQAQFDALPEGTDAPVLAHTATALEEAKAELERVHGLVAEAEAEAEALLGEADEFGASIPKAVFTLEAIGDDRVTEITEAHRLVDDDGAPKTDANGFPMLAEDDYVRALAAETIAVYSTPDGEVTDFGEDDWDAVRAEFSPGDMQVLRSSVVAINQLATTVATAGKGSTPTRRSGRP